MASPIQKTFQIAAVIIFIIGSIAVVRQTYSNAYDDLPTFYWATHLAFNDGVSAYQPYYFQQLGQMLDRKIYPFLYPPPSLLLFSPFLLADYQDSKLYFTVCNLLLWWLLTWMLYRLYCFYAGIDRHFVASLLIPLWSLIFVPVLDTFRTGQINLFVLLCAMPLFSQWPRYQQQILSGALLAIAIVLKVYLLLALPILIMTQQKKVLASAISVLALLCLISLLFLPWHLWSDWLALSHESGAYGKQLPHVMTIPWNQSINGFFIRQLLDERILSGATHWHWLIYSCSGALLAATFYITFKVLRWRMHGVSIAMAMIFLVILLIAPLTWLHHFVFAMPAIICCFALLGKLENTKYKKIMTICAAVLATIISLPMLITSMLSIQSNLVVSAQLLAGLGFWGVFCLLILRKEEVNGLTLSTAQG